MNNFQEDLQKDLIIRQQKLQAEIQRNGADACILATNINLFYTTGCVYSGYYYLPAKGKPFHFVKAPVGMDFENTIYIRKPEQIIEGLQKSGVEPPKKILLEADSLPYSDCMRIMSSLDVSEMVNASVILRKIRSVKTDFEVLQLRKCAKIHEDVYKQIPLLFKRGMTDTELQIEIERVMRQHGSIGRFHAYGANMDIHMGSLLVGENAEVPTPFDFALGGKGFDLTMPIGSCGLKIEEGNSIMVDMAGNFGSWMTDMTRVFSLGKLSELAYKAHQVSIDICNEATKVAKPGYACADLYNMSLDIVKRNKLEEYFMGTRQQAKFVGHGVGLEINEPPVLTPRSKEVLEQNIVFALEPKFVIPNVGAVGIENTYLVTTNGIEKLTTLDENIIEL